jgi:hypothetical protein
MRAETCSVYVLIFEYTLKIDVALYGFVKFLLLYRQCKTGWSALKLYAFWLQLARDGCI